LLDRLSAVEETVTEIAHFSGLKVSFRFRKLNLFWRVALQQADPADDVRVARGLIDALKAGNATGILAGKRIYANVSNNMQLSKSILNHRERG